MTQKEWNKLKVGDLIKWESPQGFTIDLITKTEWSEMLCSLVIQTKTISSNLPHEKVGAECSFEASSCGGFSLFSKN